MDNAGRNNSVGNKMTSRSQEEEDESEEEVWDSEGDDETIARIQRAHYAQAAAMNPRRRQAPKARPMSHKRKMEAVKTFHDFTKKLKKDTGITIRGLVGNNILELSDFSSESSESDSDGLSEEEFVVDPNAVNELKELNDENESYIDPETGDFVEAKQKPPIEKIDPVEPPIPEPPKESEVEEPKTLSISDILNADGELDSKNVEIAEVTESDLCPEKSEAEELLKQEEEGEGSQDFDIAEKLKEMGEISVKPVKKEEGEEGDTPEDGEAQTENDDEKKQGNPNALNVRRNIREVMDEKNLDASTLAAQRQESERLARVQEQQRIIREVQRQIAINRQNKIHQKTISLLQGGSSILKKTASGQKLNLPNTVMVKLPSGELKKGISKTGLDISKISKPTTSGTAPQKPDQKTDKKEVVEIVDSSSGEESSSSSSDSDDCIMLSDSEVPPSPEAEDDPNNSGLHVNDAYNIPDEQGRVQINIGHPENEGDIFLAPQIARVIKPHQIGGVRFLFDNIIESVERFSNSTGFGCILAHSMGLGKTLQIVCFCDIFLRHTSSKTVLCIMPINTLQNWVAEFNMWLPLDASTSPLSAHGEVRPRNFPIYVLNDSHKTLQMRAKVVKDWTTTGGVLMIGYELYRLLSMKKDKKPRKKKKAELKAEAEKEKEEKKAAEAQNEEQQGTDMPNTQNPDGSKDDGDPTKTDDKDEIKKEEKTELSPADEDKKLLDEMYEALVKPGPDLVICDEGHRIKNSHSNISYALKQMRTKRRVVLTGYPLQNNLLEYWCMVDFVRPNYLGSKTEFCNMFERPIQNGQCIDSTPQDIRLMRYRAHVLHSLLLGFVQRRSHAVLQSTLPQKEEYVLLIRMTPLQRKLYDRFMNEVVRSTSVPNPLKAFAICCKIWNHPDVLYNFLKKRSEVNAAIEEDLDLEEIGGVTKSGRARNNKAQPRRNAKGPRGASKKPAATIPPNTTTGPIVPRHENTYGNTSYPPNGPYGPPNTFRSDQPGGYPPPYPNYQNPPGYYPPNQGYNQNYDNNYYQQQSYATNNYPNQYPPNNPEGYNQNYWGQNSNYYGNQGYYNNPQYPNNQPPQDYRNNPPTEYNNSQQYPPNFSGQPNEQYPANAMQPYSNQEGYGNQRPPYQGYQNQPGFPDFNPNQNAPPYPNNSHQNPGYHNQYPPPYNSNPYTQNANVPYNQYDNQNYQGFNNVPGQNTNNVANVAIKNEPQHFPPTEVKVEPNLSQNTPSMGMVQNGPPSMPMQQSLQSSAMPHSGQGMPHTGPGMPQNVPGMPHSGPCMPQSGPGMTQRGPGMPQSGPCMPPQSGPCMPQSGPFMPQSGPCMPQPCMPQSGPCMPQSGPGMPQCGPGMPQSGPGMPQTGPGMPQSGSGMPQNAPVPYGSSNYGYQNQPGSFPNQQSIGTNSTYQNHYTNYPQHLETKPPLGSASSVSPLTSWPLTEIKTELDRLKNEEKEVKSESDGELKIADLDTKKIVKDESKKLMPIETPAPKDMKPDPPKAKEKDSKEGKTDGSESEDETPKKGKRGTRSKDAKKSDKPKAKAKGKPKGRKDRKTSKDKNNDDSESEESEKEEKLNREEELALVKKAEEVTYDWATELLKDYIPGIIENSAKMELFFYILNESIKLGDRLLLFSQSLFTLNLIEDFLERNYIPGTNCLWERNTNYYRLDGSTHALEREKLINEFNANPHVYLFLVSTRAGSLGINLVGANRVIVFDASWNPCHDTQAVCRVYRYGQKKPCFVYRFVMDCCLEKKIYDRQINKQGMADRVVDECNPDAVLSMKEITNLCFDNDEKESDPKDLSEHKDKYIDVLMQGVIADHSQRLSKEPFQHESLLVDRKEKKLSSAEKRLAQRGYELEKKAALAPKPAGLYRTVRSADGSLVQRPVASVRPMQHGARWIPADVWRRQGMTAQEMTLPLDVVIPTNSAEKTNIVLKAGQRVMVLKSPKGIYMQLESGKIIAIKTSLKGLGQKADSKDSPIGKKVLGNRPTPTNIPGSLKNNSAITITSKSGIRPGYQRIGNRPIMGPNKMRPMLPGQKINEIRSRLGDMKAFNALRARSPMQGRMHRPTLPGSVSITKIPKEVKKPEGNTEPAPKMDVTSDDETHVLDSDEDEVNKSKDKPSKDTKKDDTPDRTSTNNTNDSQNKDAVIEEKQSPPEPIVLTTDEKLPSEEALESKAIDDRSIDYSRARDMAQFESDMMRPGDRIEKKINLLKNYRHQRPGKAQIESSLSQLERTASALNKEGLPDFRKNLDDITQSYSPNGEERTIKSKKKKSPNKNEGEAQPVEKAPSMTHSVSNMLGPRARPSPPLAPPAPAPGPLGAPAPHGLLAPPAAPAPAPLPPPLPAPHLGAGALLPGPAPLPGPGHALPAADMSKASPAPGALPASPYPTPGADPRFGQYPPGYGMGYGYGAGGPYYGAYGGGSYFPPAPYGPYAPAGPPAPAPPDSYMPPNPQW